MSPGPLRPGGQWSTRPAFPLGNVAADSPIAPKWMRDFWRYVADTC
jgi:hypothetical protein